jgi:hypothetical protein
MGDDAPATPKDEAVGAAAGALVTSLRHADLVFDYWEDIYPTTFPPHVNSVASGALYYRSYPGGRQLRDNNGTFEAYYNGKWWNKGSIEAAYNSIVSTTIKGEVAGIGVPFQSQLSASCSPNYLCGYASTNMMTSFLHGKTPTLQYMQDMAKAETGATCPKSTSSPEQYAHAARDIGSAPRSWWGLVPYETIKMLVSNNKPVHVMIGYSALGDHRCSTSWNAGHSVVIVGYSQSRSMWRIHDPLCSKAATGANREIPSSAFRAAVKALSGDDGGGYVVVAKL